MTTFVKLLVRIDDSRMWDEVLVDAWDEDRTIAWYRATVFLGQSHEISLTKAQTELEALLTKLGWLRPGLNP